MTTVYTNAASLALRHTKQPTVIETDASGNYGQSANSQNTLDIIFGIVASVLAIVAILIGYLQLRQFKHRSGPEITAGTEPGCELEEVWTVSRKQTWRLAKADTGEGHVVGEVGEAVQVGKIA